MEARFFFSHGGQSIKMFFGGFFFYMVISALKCFYYHKVIRASKCCFFCFFLFVFLYIVIRSFFSSHGDQSIKVGCFFCFFSHDYQSIKIFNLQISIYYLNILLTKIINSSFYNQSTTWFIHLSNHSYYLSIYNDGIEKKCSNIVWLYIFEHIEKLMMLNI